MTVRSTPVWRLVAEHEIRSRLRDKAFLGGTALSLVILIVVLVASFFLGRGPDTYDVAVLAGEEPQLVRAADVDVTVEEVADKQEAEQLVADGSVDAALLPGSSGYTLLGDEEIDDELAEALTVSVTDHVVAANAERQDVDLTALQDGATVEEQLLDPPHPQSDGRSAVAFAFAIVFFMTALGFGMMIAQSVVREKESRVVEILAAAVPIRAMLWGKIAGNTGLAVAQVVLFAGVGVLGLALTERGELLSAVGPAVLWYVAFFLLGFVSLACLWSVAGALCSRQEDLQSATLPAQMLLIVPYFVSIFGGETIKTVFSMLPVVSTMLMPGRIAEGGVPWWQIVVAVVATLVAALALVRLGSRLYERTLLQTGRKMGYREALRTLDA